MKFCVKCQSETERAKDGSCKACARAREAAWRAANRDRVAAQKAAWYAANLDLARARAVAWNSANRDRKAAKEAARYAANPGPARARIAAWNAANPGRASARVAAWNAANPEKRRIYNQNRRARKLAAGGKLSKGLAEKLFKLQQGMCPCCRKPLGDDYHLDHIVPLALGGSNSDSNTQLLRAECNLKKQARHPIDFMQQCGFLL